MTDSPESKPNAHAPWKVERDDCTGHLRCVNCDVEMGGPPAVRVIER